MVYDEGLAQRVRELLGDRPDTVEKKMFGGLAFMVRGHMAVGIVKEDLMVRCEPEELDDLLEEKGARPMDFTGRPMKGLLFVGPAGTAEDEALAKWVARAVTFVETKEPKWLTRTARPTRGRGPTGARDP